jgi:mannose-6-phosphate isomerase-like protein (cupin superfamily)
MRSWGVAALEAARLAAGGPYLEFVRSDGLSAGLYVLEPGGVDNQQPHAEDELYEVVRGRATLVVGDERHAVGAGSLVFVKARVPHRFVEVEEELVVVVVFGPAETSRLTPEADRASG